jgi:hypothetical protein
MRSHTAFHRSMKHQASRHCPAAAAILEPSQTFMVTMSNSTLSTPRTLAASTGAAGTSLSTCSSFNFHQYRPPPSSLPSALPLSPRALVACIPHKANRSGTSRAPRSATSSSACFKAAPPYPSTRACAGLVVQCCRS